MVPSVVHLVIDVVLAMDLFFCKKRRDTDGGGRDGSPKVKNFFLLNVQQKEGAPIEQYRVRLKPVQIYALREGLKKSIDKQKGQTLLDRIKHGFQGRLFHRKKIRVYFNWLLAAADSHPGSTLLMMFFASTPPARPHRASPIRQAPARFKVRMLERF